MLILYPDTNALHADLLMIKPQSRQLLDGLLPGRVEIALSPVVLAEAQRRTREAGLQTTSQVKGSLRDIERKHGVSTAAVDMAIAALLEEVRSASDGALAPLINHPACQVLPWPDVDSEELVMREIDRRAPSRLKGDQSIGLRDTIIWHGLVGLMRSLEEGDEVLFVTADGGFIQNGALASSLVKELEDEFVDPEQVRLVNRLESAVVEMEQRRNLLTRRDGLVRQAVIDHLASFDGETWAQIDRSRNAPLRYGIEEGVVSAVDSISVTGSFDTPDVQGGSESSVIVEATAEVTVSGYMRTDEYMQEYAEVVEWMHGEIYDPMIGVEFTATVHLEAEVVVTEDAEDAWVENETLSWDD